MQADGKDAKPDAKADAKPDGKTDDKAAGPPGGDPTKGTDSKGATCTCPSQSTPPEEPVKSPEEEPAKPPAEDSESAAGSTFGLLSQQTHLGYLAQVFSQCSQQYTSSDPVLLLHLFPFFIESYFHYDFFAPCPLDTRSMKNLYLFEKLARSSS
ncbi:hypothetical protein PGT21_000205 [Puccinia graminis f. sp. tritici]|uniref:Uncharacterized protein n=1 Tax=Puccinia graminis f. sp. tritici TaxID=56615 RepID=A0A5B0MZX9_PUCGR|nr:hypothetical protein PGT21_000205 [Puccinia graminis f. sp. tritici]